MLSSIKQLRAISRFCLEGEQLPEDLLQWLGSSLEQFLSHRVVSIEEAFGLCSGRGGVPWWREEAMRLRDAVLRALAETHLKDLSLSQQARKIHDLSVGYAGTAWRFDRDKAEMPKFYENTPKKFLWQAFKSGAPMPIGERHLRTVLGGLALGGSALGGSAAPSAQNAQAFGPDRLAIAGSCPDIDK